jgi:hypothetical protein
LTEASKSERAPEEVKKERPPLPEMPEMKRDAFLFST